MGAELGSLRESQKELRSKLRGRSLRGAARYYERALERDREVEGFLRDLPALRSALEEEQSWLSSSRA